MNGINMFITFVTSLIFFIFLKFAIRSYYLKTYNISNDMFVFTVISFMHGIYCLVSASVLCAPMFVYDQDLSNIMRMISAAYFTVDTYHAYKSKNTSVVIHHFASMAVLISCIIVNRPDYLFYQNISMILAEMTNPFQNYFFLQKALYGESRKKEFNKDYKNYFLFFTIYFAFVRLFIIPIFIGYTVYIYEEPWFKISIALLTSGLVIGSIYWSWGQIKLHRRMIENEKKLA
ncbi:MAG: hypothetical protein Terrestrivirus5_84 [Terrestrivirus sp.]|uniref:TLC domain-containing protein n=1 Tax=Terrestrivirus sp. TaxID=2487775 RepID=A0A3G4ZN29_9VIRU|nr:MAG: hypothetical protein Terrestrivirus5_84 [Terrestrivirus sp.]